MMHGMGIGMSPFMMVIPLVFFGVVIYTVVKLALRERGNRGGGGAQSLQPTESAIYRLAAAHKGSLTVSSVVVGLGIESAAAEQLLQSMVDHQRVRMEVDGSGKVVYEFPELLSDSSEDR